MGRKILYLLNIVILVFFVGVASVADELDLSFGVDGRVAIEIGTHGDQANALAIQADGRILLGGSSADGSSLACSLIRLLPDGSPDFSFNGDGSVLLDLGDGDDEILALGLTADGHIVAGGYSYNGADRDFALLRFNPDGSLDTDFGDQGMVFTSVGNSDDEITALVVENNGDILVAGSAAGTNGRVVVLGRYFAEGNPDTTFSDQGLSLTGIGNDSLAQGLVVDEDDRIIISGSYRDGDAIRMMLVAFTADGLLDTGFGEEGVASTLYTREVSEGYGLFQEKNGTLYVAGSVGSEGERAAALFRFTAQGFVDSGFGEDGVLITEIGPEDDVLYSLVGNENSLNASGFTTTNSSRDFLLIVYDKGAAEYDVTAEDYTDQSEGKSATLHIRELQVADSYAAYEEKSADKNDTELLPAVITTSFGLGESVSYGLAVQDDGKVVTVGTSGDNDMTSAVVARYSKAVTPSAKSSSDTGNSVYVTTTPPSDVNATGASTGGFINPGLGTVSQRGVVFSIAPYPVCKTNCADGVVDSGDGSGGDGSGGDGSGGDSDAPVVSNSGPSGTITTSSASLSVTTDVAATCKYGVIENTAYDDIENTFTITNTTSHTENLTGLNDGDYTYYVRCQTLTEPLVAATTDTVISFTIDTTPDSVMSIPAMKQAGTLIAGATVKIGDFLVPSARAQDTTETGSTGSTSESSTTSSSVSAGTQAVVKEGYTIDGGGSGPYGSILEGLTPDTRYYLRAYAIVDGVVYYGEQLKFETANACFIATAAYGSILHPAVTVLQDFRDRYLQTNHLGRQFVAWYYTNSPPLAEKIAASSGARLVVRIALVPVIAASWLLLHWQYTAVLLTVLCGTALCIQRKKYNLTPLT